MAYTPIYERKNYVNGQAPAINATHLNDIEDALISLGNNAQTDSARLDTTVSGLSAEVTARTNADATLSRDLTNLSSRTTRTEKSLDYLWKKSKGIIYDTETVTSYAKEVSVPSGAMEYASLDMLGGMSRKCTNLWDEQLISNPSNPAEFVCQNNINLASGATYAFVSPCSAIVYFFNGSTYIGSNVGVSANGTFTVPSGANAISFVVTKSAYGHDSYNNDIAIVKGTSATYEPYTSSLIDAKCDKVENKGCYEDDYVITDYQRNWLDDNKSIWDNDTTIILLNGTASYGFGVFANAYVPSDGTVKSDNGYQVMPNGVLSNISLYWGLGGNQIIFNRTNFYTKETLSRTIGYPRYTKSLPTSITSLDGYGIGINSSCYNYLEFTDDKVYFHKKVGSVDLGSLTWSSDSGSRFVATMPNDAYIDASYSTQRNAICANYDWYSGDVLYNNDVKGYSYYFEISEKKLFIKNTSYTDASAIKSALNGEILLYELASESVTDVTSYFTSDWEILRAEANGKIQFHYSNIDTYDVGVPSTITYMIDVDEV